jgi:hypothetical protein
MLRQSLHIAVLIAAVAVLAACSSREPTVADQPAPPADAPPRTKTVLDEQLKALDKAKAVQATLDKQKADADKALEDAGG